MTQTSSDLIADYLGRLRAAAWVLETPRAADLVDGIEEHLADATAMQGDNPDTVRAILERLGPPEQLVQEALSQGGGTALRPYPVVVQRPSMVHETWTVALLTIGNLVAPVLSWIAGAVLLVIGRRWLWWEKALGLLIVPGGPLGLLLLLSFASSTGGSSGGTCVINGSSHSCTFSGTAHMVPWWSGMTAFTVGLLGPILVSLFLYRRAKQRANLEQITYSPA